MKGAVIQLGKPRVCLRAGLCFRWGSFASHTRRVSAFAGVFKALQASRGLTFKGI
jgi:hypothetical protein